jgi:hypothetical protein
MDLHLAEMRVPIRDSPLEDKLPDRRLFGEWGVSKALSVRSYPSEPSVDE